MTQRAVLVHMVSAQQNLRDIADMWPLLVTERIPGTPRPWLQTRLRRGGSSSDTDDPANFVINGVTAPVRLDVLDAMRDTLLWAEKSHRRVERALAVPHRPNPHGHQDPIAWLADIASWWDDLVEADPPLAADVATGLAHHHDAIERTLGLALEGKILPFACPYCATARALTITRDEMLGVVILCTSGACTPPPSSSPHLWKEGLPVWRFSQWSTLAAACERYAASEGGTP